MTQWVPLSVRCARSLAEPSLWHPGGVSTFFWGFSGGFSQPGAPSIDEHAATIPVEGQASRAWRQIGPRSADWPHITVIICFVAIVPVDHAPDFRVWLGSMLPCPNARCWDREARGGAQNHSFFKGIASSCTPVERKRHCSFTGIGVPGGPNGYSERDSDPEGLI